MNSQHAPSSPSGPVSGPVPVISPSVSAGSMSDPSSSSSMPSNFHHPRSATTGTSTTTRTSNLANLLNTPSPSDEIDSPPSNLRSSPSPPIKSEIRHPTTTSKRSRRKSGSDDSKMLISTSSPEGIAAAAQITSNRVANILLSEGPLPIRHLTSHLVSQVPAFGHLSLSKQRRLIMAALESGDLINNCVFEKIGWGQWEARRTTQDEVNARINSSSATATNGNSNNNNNNNYTTAREEKSPTDDYSPPAPALSSSAPSRSIAAINVSKKSNNKYGTSPKANIGLGTSFRRESITNPQNDQHNTRMPTSPSLTPLQNLRNSFRGKYNLDEAIESSSEDEDDEELEDTPPLPGDDDEGAFTMDGDFRRMHNNSGIRSGSSSRRPSFGGVSKPRKPRASFTSQTIEVKLDENVTVEATMRRPRVSFSNSSGVTRESFVRGITSPRSNPLMLNDQNMSSITIGSNVSDSNSTAKRLSQQFLNYNNNNNNYEDNSYNTDEEDWEAQGPTPYNIRRRSTQASIVSPSSITPSSSYTTTTMNTGKWSPTNRGHQRNGSGQQNFHHVNVQVVRPPNSNGKSDEEIAAFALMDLKSDS